MKRLFSISFLIVALATLALTNGLVLRDLLDIRTPSPEAEVEPAVLDASLNRPAFHIGVVSRFAPNIIYAGYQPIMDYLNRSGQHTYELRLSTSYQDAVDRLRRGTVTASFLGSWITSGLEADSNLVPLLAPLNSSGRSEFHAVLVVGPGSDLESIGQLKGRAVALPSAQSWSGTWLQAAGLPEAGLTSADLDSLHHFDHHQTVVWQVLRGHFDAGVVKESVALNFAAEGLREIARSAAIPGSPLVGNVESSPEALEEIKRLLLALDPHDPTDRAVLDGWTPEFSYGFTPVDQKIYSAAFPRRESAP